MSVGTRKFALTAHVIVSIGWFGAVAAFLALSIAGLTGQDILIVRAAYITMDLITWWVIFPLCFASLFTGLISSLGTRWGLFQYYWVVIKLIVTVLATGILLIHTQAISFLAGAVLKTTSVGSNLQKSQLQVVIASTAALVLLLALTALSIYKPRGMTRYGRKKQNEKGTVPVPAAFTK